MYSEKDIKKLSVRKITKVLNKYDNIVDGYGKVTNYLGKLLLLESKLTMWFIGIIFLLGLVWFIEDLIIGNFFLGSAWLIILLGYVYFFYDKLKFYNEVKGGLNGRHNNI